MATILIIDDNPTIRAMLRVIVQAADYRVVGEAGNGAQGIERALSLKPDIICLDVIMPGEDGLHTLIRIKEELPQTDVLMVSGKNDRDTVEAAIARGASGFIIKPFSAGTVLDTLTKTLAAPRPLPRQDLLKTLAIPAPNGGFAEASP